jgi:hypothetical protein
VWHSITNHRLGLQTGRRKSKSAANPRAKLHYFNCDAVRRFAFARSGMTIRERTEIAIPIKLRCSCAFVASVLIASNVTYAASRKKLTATTLRALFSTVSTFLPRCSAFNRHSSTAPDGGHRTTYRCSNPTPFSTTVGHNCDMKLLLHNSNPLHGSPRSAHVRPAPDLIPTSRPLSHRFPPSILLPAPSPTSSSASVPTHSNFNTSPSLHSICIRPASAAPAASF